MLPLNHLSKYKNHIKEIRIRSLYVLFSFLFVFLVGYNNALQLMHIFLLSFPDPAHMISFEDASPPTGVSILGAGRAWQKPAPGVRLARSTELFTTLNKHVPELGFEKRFIFTDLYEGFSSTLYICWIAGLLCILPFVAYQLLSFFSPSWHKQENRSKCLITIFLLLFWGGALCIAHFFFISRISGFLLTFQMTSICLSIAIEAKIMEYLHWSSTWLLYTSLFVLLFFALFYLFSGSTLSLNLVCQRAVEPAIPQSCFSTRLIVSTHPTDAIYTSTFSKDACYRVWMANRDLVRYRPSFFLCFLVFTSFLSPPEAISQVLCFSGFYSLFEILLWVLLVRLWIEKGRHSAS